MLSRLSPISPFMLLNYLFSMARIRFQAYLLRLLIGIILRTVLFVYFGAGLRSLTEVTARAKG